MLVEKPRTVFEYAIATSPEKEIGESKIEGMLPKYVLPKDTTLNTDKYKEIIGE